MKKSIKRIVSIALALAMVAASAFTASAYITDPTPDAIELENAALAAQAGSEGMILLEDNREALPIAKKGNIALFGVGGTWVPSKGGTGSGAVNNRYYIRTLPGFQEAGYNVTTNQSYVDTIYAWYTDVTANPRRDNPSNNIDYASGEVALTAQTVLPTAPTDTAIYVIARNSREGGDHSPTTKGDYLLTDREYANLMLVCQTYKHVVVCLNTGDRNDTKFYNEINAAVQGPDGSQAIDALVQMSQPGQELGRALVRALNGTVPPSGKTVNTWAKNYEYFPASATFSNNDGNTAQEDYTEGLYVGYRYFDSFYKTLPADAVTYPFGYGLSYTDFNVVLKGVKADFDKVTVDVAVTNIGKKYSGKEVVQVYFSSPNGAGKLDQPYQELATFAKTDLLAPGATQNLTLTYNTKEMSSYDEAKSAYVMEAGNYVIRVGNSSRNTKVGAVLTLAADTLTEQLSKQLDDQKLDDEWTSDPVNFYTYAGEAAEIAAAKKIALNTAGFVAPNNASEYAQDVPVEKGSPYYQLDRGMISSVNAYVDTNQATNWDGTGAPYTVKTGETVVPTTTKAGATLYDVYKGEITIEQFVAGLSVTQLANIVEAQGGTRPTSEKTNMCFGPAAFTRAGSEYEDLGIASLSLPDGPAGVRITRSGVIDGQTYYQHATCWPNASMMAQTWDVDLVNAASTGIGKELTKFGGTVWLAPGLNIHRDPLNGRNFEYYSEDPTMTGLIGIASVSGVQASPGIGVSVKHYANNNQEAARSSENNTINERAYREIYLKAFEMVTKATQPMTVMSSYNRAQGYYTAGDFDLLYDMLRGEWGFKGFVMTDWGGIRAGIVNCLYGGNDMITPGNAPNDVINAIKNNINPTIDRNGLPSYNMRTFVSGDEYIWSLGNLSLDFEGETSLSTTVTSIAGTNTSQKNGVAVPRFADVNAAYEDAVALRASSAFTATQRNAIRITNVVRTDGFVTSYTVTLYGDYKPVMRLGDLQRSAINILNVNMKSLPFAQLAASNGVSGVTVGSYSEQFGELTNYTDTVKSAIANAGTFNVDTGKTVTVPITLNAANNLSAVTGTIKYDRDLLTLESVTSKAGFSLQASGDKFIVTTNSGMGVSGDVVVGYAIFTAKAELLDDVTTMVEFLPTMATNQALESVNAVLLPVFVNIIGIPPMTGDITLDGKVDLADVVLLMQYLSGNIELTNRQLKAADASKDGVVNVGDSIIIMQMCL